MHADSFLYISRVAASKTHTFFNHFLCLQLKHYRKSSDIFANVLFLRHALYLAEWGTNANDRRRLPSLLAIIKKKDSIFLKKFFENEFSKDMEIYQKKTN